MENNNFDVSEELTEEEIEIEEAKFRPLKRLWLGLIGLVIIAVVGMGVHAKRMRSLKSGTDYSVEVNWAILEAEESDKPVDIFFLAPTAYRGSDTEFNMSLDDEKTKGKFLGASNMERGIYDEVGRFFAPYYRQKSLEVYQMEPEEQIPYMDIAISDVEAAFQYYMDNYNDGRPIILAGFSQGGELVIRLMKDYFVEESMQNQLVAAYVIGTALTAEEVANNPQLMPAAEETDLHTVIAFTCEAEDITGTQLVPEDSWTYSINPLNWMTDSTPADKKLNKGACFTDYSADITKEIPELTGCYIDEQRGTLKCPDVKADDYPQGISFFEPGVYHIYDYQFFYRNLQENVVKRTEAYLAQ